MHPSSLEASFDDVFVGTLHHTGTNRPAVASELRVLHQRLTFPQVIQIMNPFLLDKIAPQTISHTQKRTGTSMLEHMQTPFKHRDREMHSRML
jgi:hypothetical protein